MAGLSDLFGGGFTPVNPGQQVGLGGGMPYNTLAGLGMGLMGGTISNPYGAAMAGFSQGAQADALNAYRRQALQQQAAQNALHANQWQQQFNQNKYQFEEGRKLKPSLMKSEDAYGNPVYDLYNPDSQSVQRLSPSQVQSLAPAVQNGQIDMSAAPAAQSTQSDETAIPAAAAPVQEGGPVAPAFGPGVNTKEAVKKYSHDVGAQAAVDAQKAERGGRLLGLIDSLDKKIDSPQFRAITKANPVAGAASEGDPLTNPFRMGYELIGNRENKAMVDRIRQDARALQLEFSNLYYKGQGAVSDRERATVQELVGQIQQARSPEDAKALTANLRNIVKGALQKVPGYNIPTGQTGSTGGPDPLAEARSAIQAGADPAKVKTRLMQNGLDPSGL